MKVLFFVSGNKQTASSRIRVFQYLPYLESEGIDYSVHIYNPCIRITGDGKITARIVMALTFIKIILFLTASFFFKIVFIQKLYLPKWSVWILSFLNKNIIYDFDDAIYMRDDNCMLPSKYLKRFNYSISKASLVITTDNEENRNYAKQFCSNVLTITGPIDCEKYKSANTKQTGKVINIGWIGSGTTTKYLLLIKDALINLKQKYQEDICFITIGADEDQLKGLPVINYPWNMATEVELLRKFDIGIMPLPDDNWSKGKGGYKLLQYMAMGIPSVASPVGINGQIIDNGHTGLLAYNSDDWIEKISVLIQNRLLMNNLGKKAREIALKNYSLEHYSVIFLEKVKTCNRHLMQ